MREPYLRIRNETNAGPSGERLGRVVVGVQEFRRVWFRLGPSLRIETDRNRLLRDPADIEHPDFILVHKNRGMPQHPAHANYCNLGLLGQPH